MPNQPVPNVAQVKMQYVWNNENVQNVYHVSGPSGFTEVELAAIGATFLTWETDVASELRAASCELRRITVTDLTSLDSGTYDTLLATPVLGSAPGASLPNQDTLALRLGIGKRGRGRQGRTFWIGLTENDVAGNEILVARRDLIIAALNTLKESINDLADSELVIVHRYVDGVLLPEGTYDPVTSISVSDNIIDSQDSRMPGRRRKSRAATTVTP